MHMLAVHLLQELRQVKNQADQVQAFHGKTMKYESYCNIFLSAASSYYVQFASKRRAATPLPRQVPRWNVYAHDLADYGDDDINDTYNLDSDVVDLLSNVHKQHPKNPTFDRNGSFSKPVYLHLIGMELFQNCI